MLVSVWLSRPPGPPRAPRAAPLGPRGDRNRIHYQELLSIVGITKAQETPHLATRLQALRLALACRDTLSHRHF
jgi:hypothetical protein